MNKILITRGCPVCGATIDQNGNCSLCRSVAGVNSRIARIDIPYEQRLKVYFCLLAVGCVVLIGLARFLQK